ncbi:hypothetical protein K402DRAFT_371395 [Aulographum hederae CBS 113979]|uniref:DUF3752 domain-containing protein n=1 Tax=Aulographum hederae CBS 113979 TaxID=1176131 RepID=A0A6G1H993_9PEZI|nr:hypothetical protein K402DRAFT_371395 [Aulographum hederae CBS 113979]
MPSIGPELPPHLAAKRKREEEEEEQALPTPPLRRGTPDEAEKRRRIAGPAPPPAPLDERPSIPAEERDASDSDDSDSSDDFGPAPPTAAQQSAHASHENSDDDEDKLSAPSAPDEAPKLQRDAWMLAPPTHDDLSNRIDPTKLRARKFNTGKGAKGPSSHSNEIADIWTETPEQKRKRLENQVMGVTTASSSAGGGGEPALQKAQKAKEAERARKMEAARGPSLFEQHEKAKKQRGEEDDDPSKRAFDREKDMGGGMKIGTAKKKELLNHAKNFGNKFSGGNFL